jgi:excisionase family DNA binding protein
LTSRAIGLRLDIETDKAQRAGYKARTPIKKGTLAMLRSTAPPSAHLSNPPASRLKTVKQASQITGLSPNTLRKYVAEGKLTAYKVGDRLVKYDPSDLDKLVQKIGA